MRAENQGLAWGSRDTEAEVKEAAQADFDQILSSLTPEPASAAAEPVARTITAELRVLSARLALLIERRPPAMGTDYVGDLYKLDADLQRLATEAAASSPRPLPNPPAVTEEMVDAALSADADGAPVWQRMRDGDASRFATMKAAIRAALQSRAGQ